MSSYEELKETIKEFPCYGRNEKGECVTVCIGWDENGEYIKTKTKQQNGIRLNYYYENGDTNEVII